MSLSNPKWLLKISVLEKSSYMYSLSFAKDCVLSQTIYCSKRYGYNIIKQFKKCAFHRTHGNQAFVGWGDPSCLFLCLSCFLLQVAHLCSLFIILIRCREHWIVFFSKKVAAQNFCRGHGRWRKITEKKYSFKHYST